MDALSILVVDDQPLVRRNIAAQLKPHKVSFAHDDATARLQLEKVMPHICFIDLQLGDRGGSGLSLIPAAKATGAFTVVMSGNDADDNVEKAGELGCDLFYSKKDTARNVLEALVRYKERLSAVSLERFFRDCYVTEDPRTRLAVEEALRYAHSALPILILGPSGTGKTSLARQIHEQSGRKGEFVAINCSSYSEDLLESELFGSKRGAFTDAEDRQGKLLLANGGTLFLDEVGAMSTRMQTKLLKALDERIFYRIGSDEAESSDFRIISATLENPSALELSGKMRVDFLQRIRGVTVTLPGLSQRPADLAPLVDYFNRTGPKVVFSEKAKLRLQRHPWPGNIRELRTLLERLKAGPHTKVAEEHLDELLSSRTGISIGDAGDMVTADQYQYAVDHGLQPLIERITASIIRRNLAENRGKKQATLGHLRISKRLLYNTVGCDA